MSSELNPSSLKIHKNDANDVNDDDEKQTDGVLNDEFYESPSYLNLIPKGNPKWIHAPLTISKEDDNFTASFTNFIPTTTNDVHPFFPEIASAVQLFKEWSALPTNESPPSSSNEDTKSWKAHSTMTRDDIKVTISTTDNGHITKTQSLFPYSSPVLCGVFCNNEHYAAIDENILSCKILDQLDECSYTVFAECNRPFPFSKNTALLMIRFCYILGNGQVLFGETSVDGGLFEADDRTVRAKMTNLWHIEPVEDTLLDASYGTPTSMVTHYCRYQPNVQFVHRKFEERVLMDKAKHLWKLHRYLNEVSKLLHLEGQLHIPTMLLRLMDTDADSLSVVSSGESEQDLVGTRAASGSITAHNDHTVLDLNLAVKSAIVDVKQLFKKIKLRK